MTAGKTAPIQGAVYLAGYGAPWGFPVPPVNRTGSNLNRYRRDIFSRDLLEGKLM